jgi:hypothetical protein
MYDFTLRDRRDEVAVTRETRVAFAEVLTLVCAIGLMGAIVWWLA